MPEPSEAICTVPAPRENPELIGHGAAEARLFEAWRSGRLPHGWLICGPRGIGKATLAYRFARFVLAGGEGAGEGADHGPLHIEPDHPVFRRVASGGHADLVTVERGYDREGKRRRAVIAVDEIRAAGRFLGLTAGEGGWRVVIVDAADEMNANAANALLKALEEPPPRTLLLLVCHAPGRLLATVRSRCCRIGLNRLAEADVARLLARYAPDLAGDDAAVLARLSEGSIGRALRLSATGGLDLYREMVGLLQGLPGADVAAVHAFCDRLGRRDAETQYRAATELLTWWIARLVRAGARGGAAAPLPGGEIVVGEQECARRLIALAGLEQWVEVWEKITRLIAQADSINLDRKQVVLNAFHAMEHAARA